MVIETDWTIHSPAGYWEQFKLKDEKRILIEKYGNYSSWKAADTYSNWSDEEFVNDAIQFLLESLQWQHLGNVKSINAVEKTKRRRIEQILKGYSFIESQPYTSEYFLFRIKYVDYNEHLKKEAERQSQKIHYDFSTNVSGTGHQVAGGQSEVYKSLNKNEEREGDKKIKKAGFAINKWMLIIAILTVVVSIVLWLLPKLGIE